MSTPQAAPLPLAGRTAIVTGVSRRQGIGYAVARRLAALGAGVVVQHHRAHDLDQPWGGDDLAAVTQGLREALVGDAGLVDVAADLADPQAAEAVARFTRGVVLELVQGADQVVDLVLDVFAGGRCMAEAGHGGYLP